MEEKHKKIDWYMIMLILIVVVVLVFLVLNLLQWSKCDTVLKIIDEKGGPDAVCNWGIVVCKLSKEAGILR